MTPLKPTMNLMALLKAGAIIELTSIPLRIYVAKRELIVQREITGVWVTERRYPLTKAGLEQALETMSEPKPTPLQRRILERLTREGPHMFAALSHDMAIRTDTLSRAINILLEAGLIELCVIGQGVGVRVVAGKRGYDD